MRSIILVILASIFATSAQLLYKLGLSANLIFIALGIACYGIGAFLFMLALIDKNVSSLFPMFALNYVWVALGAFIFFGESLSLMKIIGLFSVVCGVTAVTWRKNG